MRLCWAANTHPLLFILGVNSLTVAELMERHVQACDGGLICMSCSCKMFNLLLTSPALICRRKRTPAPQECMLLSHSSEFQLWWSCFPPVRFSPPSISALFRSVKGWKERRGFADYHRRVGCSMDQTKPTNFRSCHRSHEWKSTFSRFGLGQISVIFWTSK